MGAGEAGRGRGIAALALLGALTAAATSGPREAGAASSDGADARTRGARDGAASPSVIAPLAGDAVPPLRAPGASLLLGQRPREATFVLDGPTNPTLPLLTSFRDASIERWGPLRVYTNNRWGRWLEGPWWSYAWTPRLGPGDDAACAAEASEPASPATLSGADGRRVAAAGTWLLGGLPGEGLAGAAWLRDRSWLGAGDRARPLAPIFDTVGANVEGDGFATLFPLPPVTPPRDWRCWRRPVTIIRYGAESDAFDLVRCDGVIPPGAHDRLSILARPPEVPRPGDRLPDEPDPRAWSERREWLPDVRLVHPRLLWALQSLADAFPRRSMYLVSGYRPLARVGGGTMDDGGDGHRSLHADGRALDLYVHGVPNEQVFEVCRKLKDVGCGYYPNSRFVHVDVRRAHTGKALWIDASAPGEPSRYVDSWPGVIESGAMGWVAPEHRVPGPSATGGASAATE